MEKNQSSSYQIENNNPKYKRESYSIEPFQKLKNYSSFTSLDNNSL